MGGRPAPGGPRPGPPGGGGRRRPDGTGRGRPAGGDGGCRHADRRPRGGPGGLPAGRRDRRPGRPGRAGHRHRQPGPHPGLCRRRPGGPDHRRGGGHGGPRRRQPHRHRHGPLRRGRGVRRRRSGSGMGRPGRGAAAGPRGRQPVRRRHRPDRDGGPPGQARSPLEALALFLDAIDHWRTSRNRALLVTTLRNLVVLLARTGRDEPAAALAATLEAAPSRSYGVEAARITAALAAVRRRLGDAAYDRAWTAGAARTLEAAQGRSPGRARP
jgi:hypothetical protein